MSDIASSLKNEISRLSKKVVRQHVSPIQSTTTQHRHQLAALKKQVAALEREVRTLRRVVARNAPADDAPTEGARVRFVAKGLKSLRSRLGLGAEDFGQLVGVTGQTVYNWESKKSIPRAEQVAAIAQLRGIGKRAAQARLEQLDTSATKEA